MARKLYPSLPENLIVRRQINMDFVQRERMEALAHLGYDVKRHSYGEASALI
jgi:hypothetical protein